MVKKGKKKGAKEPKEEESVAEKEKLTEVDRTFYELTIEDIKKKISRLRAHVKNLDVAHVLAVEELRAVQEDKTDEAAELTQQVDDLVETITELKTQNITLTEAYDQRKQSTDDTIADLEMKYKAMHDQLCSEIKRINGKLYACDEYRLNRENWIEKFEERAEQIGEKEHKAKEVFEHIEAKTIYERELLKDELCGKLTLAGEEFTGAGSTTVSSYALRLIRENIALQKSIDMLITSGEEMDERIKQESERYQTNKANIPKLEKRNSRLIFESQEKLERIKRLTKEVQELKQDYINNLTYREQNISVKEFQMCARFRRRKLQNFVRKASLQINSMEREMNMYDYLIEQYEKETDKISQHLEGVRTVIERSIGVVEQELPSSEADYEEIEANWRERNDLLGVLADLLELDFDVWAPHDQTSIDTVDRYEKFIRFEEFFKQDALSQSSLIDMCVAYIDSEEEYLRSVALSSAEQTAVTDVTRDMEEYATIIPMQRPTDRTYIVDVESGTTLYYSEPIEDPEAKLRAQVEEEDAAGAEEDSEYSSSSSVEPIDGDDAKTTDVPKSPAPTDVATERSGSSKLPPGTIVDVMTEEEFESGTVVDEGVDEDEEYDINLFY